MYYYVEYNASWSDGHKQLSSAIVKAGEERHVEAFLMKRLEREETKDRKVIRFYIKYIDKLDTGDVIYEWERS